jgi:MFS family permease
MPGTACRLLLAAMLVDTLGSGLVVPFELLFGTQLVGLSLAETGIGLSIGTGLAIAAGPIAGSLVDRFGPVRLVVAANALSIVAIVSLLAVDGLLAFTAVTLLFATAARTFWAAYAPLAAAFVGATDLETWFGRFRGARYAGLAAGSAAASFALLGGRETGLRLVLVADGLSYLAAIGLYLAAAYRRPRIAPPVNSARIAANGSGYRSALGDRANTVLAGLNVAATLVIVVPLLALPIFVLDQLRLPPWVPGALVALGTIAVAIPTFFAGRLTRGRPRIRLLAVAAAAWSIGGLVMATGATFPGVALAVLPLGVILFGLGEAVYAPTADALPIALAPPALAGRYSALHQLAWGISGTIAPVLTAWLLTAGSHAVWWMVSAAAALAAAAYLWLERRVGVRAGVAGSSPRLASGDEE